MTTQTSGSHRVLQVMDDVVEQLADWACRDINLVIMDYLINEGYPSAAQKFAKEANIQPSADAEAIQQRVGIRNAIHAGDIQLAIERINELNPQVSTFSTLRTQPHAMMIHVSCTTHIPSGVDEKKLTTSVLSLSTFVLFTFTIHSIVAFEKLTGSKVLDTDPVLHFSLLRLQLIELIRATVSAPGLPSTAAFTPALEFATAQLAPRAPTSKIFLEDLEKTMALLIFPPEKLTPPLKALLDPSLRQTIATAVNEAILSSQGERREARIRSLVRLRAWAEQRARENDYDLPDKIKLELGGPRNGQDGDAMVT